ncbi:MAG: phosphoglycerate dehydrogenase [Bacteroidetes bacterium]|nr:phosphoglycerate dehydrogenase [Bacteroidota bacterium]
MAEQQYYVFDFDSTFVQVEALEELGEISLKGSKNREKAIQEIREITDLGIEGKISFTDGLRKRLSIIEANSEHLEKLIRRLRKKVSKSISRNQTFFTANRDKIYVISAGFKEFIVPIVADFGIPADRVFGNTFTFDKKGNINGFDKANVLSQSGGKVKQLEALGLKGEIFVVGDGYTDYQMKFGGEKVKFFAFTENIDRESASSNADHVTPSLDEFLYHNNLPMEISYPKNRIRVLLLENIHAQAEEAMRSEGYQVERLTKALSEDELCEAIKGVSILGIRSKTRVTKKVLAAADRLAAIGAFCIGTNQIDLEASLERGVAVFNAPYSNTRSVVELVIGEIILLMRGIPEKDRLTHRGIWDKSANNSNEIRGKTLGIVGYGNIGSQLSVLAEGLGMKVIFFDKVDKLALGNAQRMTNLRALLKTADIVSLHVDGDMSNRDFFGEKEIAMMKDGAILLNLSRGFVVDVKALAKALKSGKLRGAGVDVFPKEPASNDDPFETELQGIPNVILTPHVGGSTTEAQMDIAAYVPDKLINYINTGNSFMSVNFPHLQLPLMANVHRLLHIHRNVPGILAQINQVLSAHGCNIEGQYLKTNETIGYVITDINKKYDTEVIKALRGIENTIKFRVLY